MNISFWSLERLNRWEVFQFLYDVVEFTDSHSEGMSELFNSKFATFSTAFEAYDEALVQERKTAPKLLIEAEEGRDLAIRKMYSLISEYSTFPYEPAKEEAANLLLKTFKPYGTGSSIANMAQDAETAVLINLIQDFDKDREVEEAIQTLGLNTVVNTLRSHNAVFKDMQQQRLKDDARIIVGIVKSTRTKAQKEFVSFVEIVNALALIEGEEKFADLKLEINKLHKNVMARAEQRTKKKEEETDPELVE